MDVEEQQRLRDENAALRRQVEQLYQQLAAAGRPPAHNAGPAHPATQAASLETLLAALPDYIYIVERDGMRITFCNDVFARGIGYPDRASVEGRTIYDCFTPEDAARFAAQNEQVFASGVTLREVEQVDLSDGTHHFDTYKIPIFDPAGQVIGLIGSSREIRELVEDRWELAGLNSELEQRIDARTQELSAANERLAAEVVVRARAEEALRTSERRYRLITEHSGDLILLIDLSDGGTILYASPSHRHVMGLDPDQIVGGRGLTGVHPDDIPEAQRIVQEATLRGFAEGPLRIRDRKGAYRWIEGRMSSFVEDGRTLAVLVARDITERRQLEAQLFQAQKLDGIGRLAGSVAHDFNNLLVVISGSAELARDSLPADHPAHEDLSELQQAADRAAGLTRQLLTFARRQVSDPQPLDLNRLIGGLRRLLRRLVREDIVLAEALDAEIWPVRGDPGQIEQVLVNLVINAQDAMPHGGTLTIESANVVLDDATAGIHPQLAAGAYVVVAVVDTGVGMTEEVARQAFEPFFTTKPPGQGTGLGLSTCYGIITQHGGGIYLYSEPDHGTVVKVYLPRAAGLAAGEPAAASLPAPADGAETVLLVEDDQAVRTLGARILRGQGYTVIEAGSGAEALTAVAAYSGPIHLLLTDTVMPGISGPALAAQLKALRPDLRTLIMSGYAPSPSVAGLNFGADGQLQKPFTPITLIRAVRSALDGPRDKQADSGS
jgi:PAS domain S-box-containing protein